MAASRRHATRLHVSCENLPTVDTSTGSLPRSGSQNTIPMSHGVGQLSMSPPSSPLAISSSTQLLVDNRRDASTSPRTTSPRTVAPAFYVTPIQTSFNNASSAASESVETSSPTTSPTATTTSTSPPKSPVNLDVENAVLASVLGSAIAAPSSGSARPKAMPLIRQRAATFGDSPIMMGIPMPAGARPGGDLKLSSNKNFPLHATHQTSPTKAAAQEKSDKIDKHKRAHRRTDMIGADLMGELMNMMSKTDQQMKKEDLPTQDPSAIGAKSPTRLRRQTSSSKPVDIKMTAKEKEKEKEQLKKQMASLVDKPLVTNSPPTKLTRKNSALEFFGFGRSSDKELSRSASTITPAFKPSMKLFGSAIENIMTAQKPKYWQHDVPVVLPVLRKAILECNGLGTEGIFRVPGKATEISRLKQRLDDWDFEIETKDIHVLAGVLKTWLRELPSPIVPSTLYYECLKTIDDATQSVSLLEKFPPLNKSIVLFMTDFLREFINPESEAKTLMGLDNISMVFAPGFMRCPSNNPTEVMVNSELEKMFVKNLIEGTSPEYKNV